MRRERNAKEIWLLVIIILAWVFNLVLGVVTVWELLRTWGYVG